MKNVTEIEAKEINHKLYRYDQIATQRVNLSGRDYRRSAFEFTKMNT